jgi:hypothetical protein
MNMKFLLDIPIVMSRIAYDITVLSDCSTILSQCSRLGSLSVLGPQNVSYDPCPILCIDCHVIFLLLIDYCGPVQKS